MRPALWLLAGAAAAAGCGGGGGDRLSSGKLTEAPATLRLSSPQFTGGARLARRFTCDAAGEEPAVRVRGVPAGTRELVLIVSDPDAPGGTFVHLTRYGIRPGASGSVAAGREGANSAGRAGWTPPCPPKGDRPHRYIWSVYALRERSGLKAGADPGDVTAALGKAILARGTLTARYGR